MFKIIRFLKWYAILIIPHFIHANILHEIFSERDILKLYDICKKISKETEFNDATFALSQFLYHNDRDFYDCCEIYCVCKILSEKRISKKTEKTSINCVKTTLFYLHAHKSVILSLYQETFSKTDICFLNELDVSLLLKKVDEIEKKGKISNKCVIF